MTNTFTYLASLADWGRIAPELVLVGIILLVMLVDLVLPHSGERSKHSGPANFVILPVLAVIGLVGAMVATILLMVLGDHQRAFNEMIGSDWGTLCAYLIILTASTLGILLSPAYLKRIQLVHQGEYYALMLLATMGMLLLAAATSFLVIFLGIEMLSLALYILCSFVTRRKSSQESGMKYFLLSSFASAFLLYGIALTYGATGSTALHCVAQFFRGPVAGSICPPMSAVGHGSSLMLIAMGLLAVGFAFKVSAIPFQAWTPDVYEGAPAPVTAFMSVGTKAAALIAFARVFSVTLAPLQGDWIPVVWAITVLTIVGGNVMAVIQSNVKRLLAYSSIAHAGYLLIGIIIAGSPDVNGSRALGISAIFFYLICYTFLNLGAFGIITVLERADNTGSDLRDLRGLWNRRPVLAGLLAFFMLALAGFPPMAGFAAKYYIFYAALAGGHAELLIIGVLASILGIYYYLRVAATMFMEQDSTEAQTTTASSVPATPVPTFSGGYGRVPAKARTADSTGSLASGGAATAVAVKTTTASLARTPTASLSRTPLPTTTSTTSVEETQVRRLQWMTWLALGLTTVGVLFMGTIFPLWLTNLKDVAQAFLNSIF